MAAQAQSLSELRMLVERLEQSGLAGQRADVAALLDRSRATLASHQEARPGGWPGGWNGGRRPRQRPVAAPAERPPRRRRVRRGFKVASLLLVMVDGVAAMLGAASLAGLLLADAPPEPAPLVLAGAVLWGIAHRGRLLVAEAAFGLTYMLRWAWLWVAEAFSDAAFEKLQILLDARDVMAHWRDWRRSLSRPPRMADVEAFLAETHGPAVAALFLAQGEARWGRRRVHVGRGAGLQAAGEGFAEQRVRWSRLIRLFEGLAAADAFWPEAPMVLTGGPGHGITADPAPEPEPEPDPPERIARREQLKEMILAKREEIQRAQDWKMKTPGEMAQRDAHVADLRRQHDAMEAELREIGGVPPPILTKRRR
jgi:hypothetical protein